MQWSARVPSQWIACAVAGAILGPLPSRNTLTDPPRPTASLQLAYRKDLSCDDSEPAPAEPEAVLGTLVNIHTGELVILGDQEPTAERFSTLLEDRVTGARAAMAPALVDLLRTLACGREAPRFELVSGYRSWKLNEILRKKGRRGGEP